ncbi:hypothetical protein LCGC14_2856070 [marine sediment metagenome]|uniref:Uncharacterized protein n=1 Tax=marine sediment metagenome TaxID=412755 RepID=A0A0F8Y777_9ZZZZ
MRDHTGCDGLGVRCVVVGARRGDQVLPTQAAQHAGRTIRASGPIFSLCRKCGFQMLRARHAIEERGVHAVTCARVRPRRRIIVSAGM